MEGGIGDDGDGLVIVSEQFAELGGAERIAVALLDRWPAARFLAPDFWTSVPVKHRPWSLPEGHPLAERVEPIPAGGGPKQHFRDRAYSRAVARHPLGDARVVLTLGSCCWPHAAAIPDGARHVAFAHGSPRHLDGMERPYLRTVPAALRPLVRASLPARRRHTARMLARAPVRACASTWSARRLERFTGLPWQVVHPPVATIAVADAAAETTSTPDARRRIAFAGRLHAHKRPAVMLDVARLLPEHDVVIAGDGPLRDSLTAIAPANVTFTGRLADRELHGLLGRAAVVVVPSTEEFGIVAGEALAAGTPVVAPRDSGTAEIVEDGRSGLLLADTHPAAIAGAIQTLLAEPPDAAVCRVRAERFTTERFLSAMAALLAPRRSVRAAPRSQAPWPPAVPPRPQPAREREPAPSPAAH